MKSITIHKMDNELASAIEKLATKLDLSKNKTIKTLLRKGLGLPDEIRQHQDFSKFCGIWEEEEKIAFDDAVAIFDKMDDDLWQ